MSYPGTVQQSFLVEQVILWDLGFGDFRLATIRAVLGTQPALGVHQQIELDRLAEVAMANAVRRG